MKKSTRTFLFFSLLIIFLIIAPAIVSYSQGYRIDWENKTIVKTGAMFLEPRPAPVELFINGKLRKKSNFVFQNIFIGDLLPKSYIIEIKKEGYSPWIKSLEISEKLVTETKNVMLFPSAPEIKEIKGGIKKFSFSPSGKHIIFIEDNKIPRINLYDRKDNRKRPIFRASKNLTNWEISDIQWNKDSTKLIFALKNRFNKIWMTTDITEDQPKTVSLSTAINTQKYFKKYTASLDRPSIDNLKWSPTDASVIFFTVQETYPDTSSARTGLIFSYDIKDEELPDPLTYDVLNYALTDKKILYVSSISGGVNLFDLETGDIKQISLEKISEDINNIYISSDGKKAMLLNDYKIKVYWLEDVHIQPFRDAGDLREIYGSDKKILSAVWFSKDNEHIIFSTNEGIQVIELDDRGRQNIHTLSTKPTEAIFYEDATNNSLYILSDSTLYSISLK